jgi:uroporphyrin-III C-methyltransferase/precorrin-2 dehydrogenase/sirohydrochlorin ferrochelatase
MLPVLNRAATAECGMVAIVGTGPGDPDLLTLRALQLMEQADVVLTDALVAPAILDRVRRDAIRIALGARTTAQVEDLMVAEARKGLRVLRLESGDARATVAVAGNLRRRGVAVVVVPGIATSAGVVTLADAWTHHQRPAHQRPAHQRSAAR